MGLINILIVENESIVARDLSMTLSRLGHNIVGIANSGERAISLAKEFNPQMILMDINLGVGISGIEAGNKINKKVKTAIVYLTAFADEKTLEKAKETDRYGYLLKPYSATSLKTTIELAYAKYKQETEKEELAKITKDESAILLSFLFENTITNQPITLSELKVLDLLVEGKSNLEIKNELFISLNTVKFHIKNIYKKFKVNTRFQLLKAVFDNLTI